MARSDIDPVTSDACLRCGHALANWGVVEFRTGGTGGAVKLLIGEWGELGEQKIPLDFRYCTSCGQVDLRLQRDG
jgi:hypothetical protein